jgi:hypothetical protein
VNSLLTIVSNVIFLVMTPDCYNWWLFRCLDIRPKDFANVRIECRDELATVLYFPPDASDPLEVFI